MKTEIKYFNNKPIRCVTDEETGVTYYAIIDTVLAIRDTKNARRYWADQKRRHPQLAALAKTYKLTARDNKNYMTDVMDEESMETFLKSVKYKNYTDFANLNNEASLEEPTEIETEKETVQEVVKAVSNKETNLYEDLSDFEVGSVYSLQEIQYYFTENGDIRTNNLNEDGVEFVPGAYLNNCLLSIDEMKDSTFNEIVDKFTELYNAHPFETNNNLSLSVWLNNTLAHRLNKIVDFKSIKKEDYLNALRKSPVNNSDLVTLLENHCTNDLSKFNDILTYSI